MSDSRPIGVFDSGLGGLTVLAELVRALPNERFIYFGDTARVPYGAKSARIVQRYSDEVSRFLLGHDIKLLVIACNTATAHAESLLRKELSIPVLGVIQPGVDALLAGTQNRRVGVLATRSTIKSGAYERRILEREPSARVYNKACALFVPLVEEGWIDKRVTGLVMQEYLSELVREEVDTVVLGCTHYPLLKKSIREQFPDLQLIDSSEETARATSRLLEESGIRSQTPAGGVRIFLTDITDQMNHLETLLAGLAVSSVEEVQL